LAIADPFGAEDLGSTSGVFIFTDRGGDRIERATIGRRWQTSVYEARYIRVSEKPGKIPAFLCLAFVCLGINHPRVSHTSPAFRKPHTEFPRPSDICVLVVSPAFRELRGSPHNRGAGTVRINRALIGEVVEEQVHLPIITHEAGTKVADVIAGIQELRGRCIKPKWLEPVEAVTGKRPLEADEEIMSTQQAGRLVILGPRRCFVVRDERQPHSLPQLRLGVIVEVMVGVSLGRHIFIVEPKHPVFIR